MSLSPYLNPQTINGSFANSGAVTDIVNGRDGYDKNHPGLRTGLLNFVDTIKDISDSVGNLSGTRSPMYTIGEIRESTLNKSEYYPDSITGISRAISASKDKPTQYGVIIDGLDNMDGTFSMEISSNPALYKSSNINDHRYRAANKLSMTVLVSNYLTDSVVDKLENELGEVFGHNIIEASGNTRSQLALLKLRVLMETCVPFTVYTPHGIYDNMVIKQIRVKTDESNMDSLQCDIDFQEVLYCYAYSDGTGTIPARGSIDEVREGWTTVGTEKLKIFGYGVSDVI